MHMEKMSELMISVNVSEWQGSKKLFGATVEASSFDEAMRKLQKIKDFYQLESEQNHV